MLFQDIVIPNHITSCYVKVWCDKSSFIPPEILTISWHTKSCNVISNILTMSERYALLFQDTAIIPSCYVMPKHDITYHFLYRQRFQQCHITICLIIQHIKVYSSVWGDLLVNIFSFSFVPIPENYNFQSSPRWGRLRNLHFENDCCWLLLFIEDNLVCCERLPTWHSIKWRISFSGSFDVQ